MDMFLTIILVTFTSAFFFVLGRLDGYFLGITAAEKYYKVKPRREQIKNYIEALNERVGWLDDELDQMS